MIGKKKLEIAPLDPNDENLVIHLAFLSSSNLDVEIDSS